MKYVPPKKNPRKKYYVLLVLCFLILLTFLAFYIYNGTKSNQQKQINFCNLSYHKSKELFVSESEQTYEISDYLFYGENLNIYQQPYENFKKDDLFRKGIELKNLCTNETWNYTLESYIDRQIDLKDLTAGTYQIYVVDNYEKKAMVAKNEVESEAFYSLPRNGKRKKIQIKADKNMFYDQELKYNYLYLQIDEVDANQDVIDIVLDPYGKVKNEQTISMSSNGNGLDESKEMYEYAMNLKKELEKYGLKVEVTRKNENDSITYYGENSVLKKAYEKQAKYYFELGMSTSPHPQYRGMEIYHSYYSSSTMANQFIFEMKKKPYVKTSNYLRFDGRYDGVAYQIKKEKDVKYDLIPTIRESGSRATGAGKLTSMSAKNQSFIQENQGMQALSVNFIYISNQEDATSWKQHKQDYVVDFAQAIKTILKL